MKEPRKSVLSRWVVPFGVVFVGLTVLVGRSDLYRDISENWKLVYEVYKRVMTNYADRVNPERLAVSGIKGMLAELDPYSIYLEDQERDGLNMLTKGKYGGVGIQLGVRDDSLTVIAPIDDSPAMRSGILPGDRIIAIDGKSTKDMNLDEAARDIRGEKGSKVILTILRYGEVDPLDFELIRDIIRIEDVSYAGMIGDGIGYVRLSRFSRNSAPEIRKAFRGLMEQDLDKLIVDLRGNPGGLLEAAIQVLDMMVEEGEEILSTRGRNGESDRTFVAQTDPLLDSRTTLAILIDGGSASASEIVAGVIQDLDRGVIVGSPSFGKGLVQSVYPLDPSRSLKLTTAKYYLPSGRLIQKPGYLRENMVLDEAELDTVFDTRNGRKVLARGGITPDIEVPPLKMTALTRECWRRGLFFKFASLTVQRREMPLPVVVDDEMLLQFNEFLDSKELTLNVEGEKEFRTLRTRLDSTAAQRPVLRHSLGVLEDYFDDMEMELFEKSRSQLMVGLEREFSSLVGGIRARIQSSFDDDPVILRAREVLSDRMSYDHTLNPS
ncbi:MAG: S41 family peptidase [Fidelibacterota bacterium]